MRARPLGPPPALLAVLGAVLAHPAGAAADGLRVDRAHFFAHCSRLNHYEQLPHGQVAARGSSALSGPQRLGIEGLLDAWERLGDDSPERLAFVLATARRESAGSFQPVREAARCGNDEACRERAIGDLLARRAAKAGQPPRANYALPATNGQRYYGRGYVQITFAENYRLAGRKLGLPLEAQPDLALSPEVAGAVLIRGMLEGWFGARKPLATYIGPGQLDFTGARSTVNPGSPNKSVTAAYASDLLACIRLAEVSASSP